jgi:hypothetical protein
MRPEASMLVLVAVMCAALLLPSAGRAAGGRYAFTGGTPRERAEVVRALEASSFDWELVPDRVTIHVERGTLSRAVPGEIWLDANLLRAGSFSWGVVQHEYAHEVDFFLLSESERAGLLRILGARVWCAAGVRSDEQGCELFASALAWAYWPSPDNCMRPPAALVRARVTAERFRTRVAQLISSVPTETRRGG